MRCHCHEGWLHRQDDGVYICDSCGDKGLRNHESGDIITIQGCVYLSAGGCWSYDDEAEPIEHWLNVHDVRHLSAYEFFQRHKRWPEGFMPGKVYCREGWQSNLRRTMAAAWMKMVLSYKGRTKFEEDAN